MSQDTVRLKKIYFAGSIRGGRDDAGLYKKMIAYIQRENIVLTEHVGDLSLSKAEGREDRDADIYEQDTAWLRETDLVIAECSTPSLGVGYELAYAEAHGKPVHIFYNKARTKLSAMLSGDRHFHIHPYGSEEELWPLIDAILKITIPPHR
jgi:nucleoside 2-deoxyribosyltransferase